MPPPPVGAGGDANPLVATVLGSISREAAAEQERNIIKQYETESSFHNRGCPSVENLKKSNHKSNI
jgi:hypothetical protein